jgi:hypothetical protein
LLEQRRGVRGEETSEEALFKGKFTGRKLVLFSECSEIISDKLFISEV